MDLASGVEELKRRLEVLLGARPDAPVDESEKVRIQTEDGRAPRLLLSVLSRQREQPPLRTQAALLLGQLKDPGSAPAWAAALDRLLTEAKTDLALEATATGTLRALAELGGPIALKAALRMHSDPRPVLRRSASEALGKLCDPGPGAEALRAATRESDAGVAGAASAALRRCGSAERRRQTCATRTPAESWPWWRRSRKVVVGGTARSDFPGRVRNLHSADLDHLHGR